MDKKDFLNDLLKLVDKIIQNKIYGSLEIYFEDGKITQVTQRIINKIQSKNPPKEKIKKPQPEDNSSTEYRNIRV